MYGVVRCTSVHGALWTDVSCSYLLSMTVDWIGLILVASGTGCLPKRNERRSGICEGSLSCRAKGASLGCLWSLW